MERIKETFFLAGFMDQHPTSLPSSESNSVERDVAVRQVDRSTKENPSESLQFSIERVKKDVSAVSGLSRRRPASLWDLIMFTAPSVLVLWFIRLMLRHAMFAIYAVAE